MRTATEMYRKGSYYIFAWPCAAMVEYDTMIHTPMRLIVSAALVVSSGVLLFALFVLFAVLSMRSGEHFGLASICWIGGTTTFVFLTFIVARVSHNIRKMYRIESDAREEEKASLVYEPEANEYIQQTEGITPYPQTPTLGEPFETPQGTPPLS
eukprot:CAMPEP_0114621458 /NCGR_PEP_ID=MMETSP0168-20121206/9239_1 /TAXON_ID=95228 ORGANISM="Vannella sp., Strain DIVA3 517/6/12" /NCGR_SAMPLE_ID=MMETSP0168 /ASSEMBLY_ACC=CAM_ASM_000044 /LENGTH=153 /DNA_ID=CAMNT_0001832657 /DNA_START=35 /DNA_END=496 /DNA_ORIENTATION=-